MNPNVIVKYLVALVVKLIQQKQCIKQENAIVDLLDYHIPVTQLEGGARKMSLKICWHSNEYCKIVIVK